MEAFHFFSSTALDHPDAVIGGVVAVAQWPLYGVPVLLAGLWILGDEEDRASAVFASLSAALALALASGASHLVDRPRPFVMGLAPNVLDHAADSSFPSDHAALFVALSLAFLARPPRSASWLWMPLVLVAVAVGWARVALGLHFPIDVAGAAVIAAAAVGLMHVPLRRAAAMVTSLAEAVRRRLPLGELGARGDRDARPAG